MKSVAEAKSKDLASLGLRAHTRFENLSMSGMILV